MRGFNLSVVEEKSGEYRSWLVGLDNKPFARVIEEGFEQFSITYDNLLDDPPWSVPTIRTIYKDPVTAIFDAVNVNVTKVVKISIDKCEHCQAMMFLPFQNCSKCHRCNKMVCDTCASLDEGQCSGPREYPWQHPEEVLVTGVEKDPSERFVRAWEDQIAAAKGWLKPWEDKLDVEMAEHPDALELKIPERFPFDDRSTIQSTPHMAQSAVR